MSLISFFQNIGSSISNWFHKEQPIVQKAYTDANNVVNIIKSLAGSATGQTVELIIEALAPGVGSAVIAGLNTFFTDWGLVTAGVGKSPSQIAADGLNKLSTMTGDSKTAGLHAVTAIIGHTMSTANGGDSTLQQALTTIGLIHNPNLLSESQPAAAIVPAPASNLVVDPPVNPEQGITVEQTTQGEVDPNENPAS